MQYQCYYGHLEMKCFKRIIAQTSTVRLIVSGFNDNDAFAISFPSVF